MSDKVTDGQDHGKVSPFAARMTPLLTALLIMLAGVVLTASVEAATRAASPAPPSLNPQPEPPG